MDVHTATEIAYKNGANVTLDKLLELVEATAEDKTISLEELNKIVKQLHK